MYKVRNAIRAVERDGWYQVRMNGSHRIFHHPVKRGIVIIAGHPGKDLKKGVWDAIMKQAGIK